MDKMKISPKDLKSIKEAKGNLLPSEKDLQFYNEHGWYVSPIIIEDEVINAAMKGAEEFYAGILDHSLENDDRIENSSYSQDKTIHNNEFVTLQKQALSQLGFHDLVLATAAILSGSKSIRLFADSLVSKDPSPDIKNNAVGWHTDKAYWPTCTSDQLLTAWIPLQDCTIDMGPLFHIDKSHKWKDIEELKQYYSFNNQDLGGLEQHLKSRMPEYQEIPMLLKKGQVSFHNCNTIHASRPNTSNLKRMALAMHFQDDTNKYQKAYKATGELISIGYDKLCRKDSAGNPDYSDPRIFPLLLH